MDSDVDEKQAIGTDGHADNGAISPTEPYVPEHAVPLTEEDESSTEEIKDFFLNVIGQPELDTGNHEEGDHVVDHNEELANDKAVSEQDIAPILPALEMIDCCKEPEDPPPAQEEPCVIPVQHEGEHYTVKVNPTATIEQLRWRLAWQWGVLPSWLKIKKGEEDINEENMCDAFDGQELSIEMKLKIQRNAPPSTRAHARPSGQAASSSSSSNLPLRGGAVGGRSVDAAEALIDDDARYRHVLSKATTLCRRLKKPQLKLLLRGDPPLQRKLEQSDDASVIRLLEAAAKRVGMTLHDSIRDRPHSEAPPRRDEVPRSETPKTRASNSETEGNWVEIVKRKGKQKVAFANDQPCPRIVIEDGQLNVPVVQSLRPDEDGVVVIHDKNELIAYKKRIWGSSGAAAIAPAKFEDVQDMTSATYLLKVSRYLGETLLTTHMTEVAVYQLGKAMPVKLTGTPSSVKIEPQRATCVIGIEVEKTDKTEDLWRALTSSPADTKSALTIFRQRHIQGVNEQDILDMFLPNQKERVARCLVRTTVQVRDMVLASSGSDAIYCSPSPADHNKYAIVWFARQQVENVEEARRLAMGKPHLLGLVCKRNAQNGPTFGLRTLLQHRDALATALGRLPGARYALHGCPIDWVEAEVQQLCDEMKWRAAPVQGSQRMKRNSAIWSVRALDPPPLASIAVSSGDASFTVKVVEPTTAESKQRAKKQEPPKQATWTSVLPTRNKPGKLNPVETFKENVSPPVEHSKDDQEYEQEAKRKRPASVPRQEAGSIPPSMQQPSAPHQSSAAAPVAPPAPATSASSEVTAALQAMATQLQSLQTYMQTVQTQVGHLTDKVGKIDSVVHEMTHPEDEDEVDSVMGDHE